jgi:hypothetical protein
MSIVDKIRRNYDYCFYRCADLYERTEGGGAGTGCIVMSACTIFQCGTFLHLIYWAVGITTTHNYYYTFGVAFLVYNLYRDKFKDTDEKLKALRNKYRNETNRRLKGWLVFLYITVSTFLYAITMYPII